MTKNTARGKLTNNNTSNMGFEGKLKNIFITSQIKIIKKSNFILSRSRLPLVGIRIQIVLMELLCLVLSV
jgi:hypothetical protein